jgi:hypothetical protein
MPTLVGRRLTGVPAAEIRSHTLNDPAHDSQLAAIT